MSRLLDQMMADNKTHGELCICASCCCLGGWQLEDEAKQLTKEHREDRMLAVRTAVAKLPATELDEMVYHLGILCGRKMNPLPYGLNVALCDALSDFATNGIPDVPHADPTVPR